MVSTTTKFRDQNPKVYAAVLKALEEAIFVEYGMISDPKPMTAKALREARTLIRESCRAASGGSQNPVAVLLPRVDER